MSKPRKEEYERLKSLINQWNIDHYDIFELSKPNENLEFHGVVRFFFQGGIGANVITKCIRVSSTATTREVIDVLIEKFRPDMRMLSQHKYALYEVHVNGEERRLADDEKPLYVQLNWGSDVREGRFLLRNEDHPTVRDPALGFDKAVLQQDQGGFKRKLSKREKKEIKKKERERGKENMNGDESVANKLYEEAPESSFTRSISNPEAVMRRRRQQKLEKKLAQMNATDGGADSGGTLKIYGESLRPDVPYKTLFLSTADPATAVVEEALDKYGLEKEEPSEFCLVEVLLPSGGMEYHGETRGDERVLDDNECPLAIVIQHAKRRDQGHIIFQLRRRMADSVKRRQKQRSVSQEDLRAHPSDHRHTNLDALPYLTEVNVRGKPKRHVLPLNVTEVVNVTEVANNRPEYNGKHFLQLSGPDIRPRHCVIAHTEGVVTVTPNSQNAETYVDGQRIYETTMLKHGMTVQFGKDKFYRFLDPRFDEPAGKGQPYQLPNKLHHGQPQETNFDVDGHIETVSGGASPRPGTLSWDSQQKRSLSDRSPSSIRSQGSDDLLPASVEYSLDAEHHLMQHSILEVKSKQLQFKLAPTYTLYMAVRHLLSPRSPVTHRAQLVTDFANKTSKMIQRSIQDHHNDPSSLAFWMANSSEILHMFKQDRDIQPLTGTSQEMLAEAVQTAFHHLVRCLQGDLQRVMPAFLDPSDASEDMGQGYNMGHPTLDDVLDTLSAAMTLLRRCRVNAALTIQLFSQLFHFINMWLFNILVTEPQLTLCTRTWGSRLKRRLGRVETWAEKQGLELAADCHLCRIIQAAHLLQAPKSSTDDITTISSACFKLNSLQLQCLLIRYIPEPNEPPVSSSFVEHVVSQAENMADELTRSDKREVQLEEDSDLHLPFLLPEDGYSCDTIRGIPNGLPEFVKQLESAGMCRFVVNSSSSGSWTVYMGDEHLSSRTGGSPDIGLPSSPEIIHISFNKVKGSMGLSIVAAIGEGQPEQGIYIKSVVDGGAAALDGRMQAGDQLLEVDDKSLVGVSQDKAAELMTKTGQVVKLKIAKRAVLYHNLGSLLSQSSPTNQRAGNTRASGPSRTFSDEGPPPPYDGRGPKTANVYAGNHDKTRAPSSGNLADTKSGGHDDMYNNRHDDSRSKSTSNLHVESNLDHNSMHQNMKPAQSVGVLHPSHGYSHRPDIRPNDYENQPRYPQAVVPQGKPQNLHPSQGYPQRTSDRSSVSSRTSSNGSKEVRPVSAYLNNNNNTNIASKDNQDNASRPKSEDVGNKLKEWQESYKDPRAGSGSGRHSPPYSNIGTQNKELPPQPTHNPPPKPSAHERLFNQPSISQKVNSTAHQPGTPQKANSTAHQPGTPQKVNSTAHQPGTPQKVNSTAHQPGTPQKVNSTAYNRQPNFFENTTPLQREPLPAYHQLQRPPSENDVKLKPAPNLTAVPAKKNWPRVQHMDVPNLRVDNRQTQPYFFGNIQPSSSPPGGQPNSAHQQPSLPQFDQRNMPYDQRHSPHQQDQRSIAQPDVRNGPRFGQDLTSVPDQRNGSMYEYRSLQQDPRDITDLRNAPDPRNLQLSFVADSSQQPSGKDSIPQQQGGRDNFLQQPNGKDSFSQRPSGKDSFPQQQTTSKISSNRLTSHFQEQKITDTAEPYFNHHQHVGGDRDQYGYLVDDSSEFPPPPVQKDLSLDNIALQTDDYQEDLPPLPPPPSHEALVEQRLAEEQLKLMQHINATNQFLAADPRRDRSRYSPLTVQPQPPLVQQPQSRYQQQPQNPQPSINRVLPAAIDPRDLTPLGFQVVPDGYKPVESASYSNYQNIGFPSEVRASSKLESQVKPAVPASKPKLRGEISTKSAWDRDAKEKAQEEEKEELFRAREKEMADLESRHYLSPLDQDRLRKLRMEHEFQRRVKEVAETDYEYEQDDNHRIGKTYNNNSVIDSLKDDLEKSQERMRQFELTHTEADASREQDRMQILERRLGAYEKEREEITQKMQKKQENRARQQHDQRQRDYDKYEDNSIPAGAHRDDEGRILPIDSMRSNPELQQNQNTFGYLQYNVSNQSSVDSSGFAPPPPERTSSYDTFTHHQLRASFKGNNSANFPTSGINSNVGTSGGLPSALKGFQEPPTKKSVSFNTQMNTYKDRTPSQSVSSYRSPTGSFSSDQGFTSATYSPDVDVFESSVHPLHNTHSQSSETFAYNSNTPNVIGTQEIYRDPRFRIEAKLASQSSRGSTDRMSFRDKMKLFSPDDTIKLKPKSSKTLREIESQLSGQ